MKDELGRRFKREYEDALRFQLPRHSYYIVRIDGRGFHTFTAELERPYCQSLADALDAAAISLSHEMIGCRFAYGQSDEYSFLLSDIQRYDSPLWFDGNIQKIVSVSASLFTGAFNQAFASTKSAAFDSRVIAIPKRSEVEKYFHWRQLDAEANSLNMLASSHYSHEELLNKPTAEKHDLLNAKGINWAKQTTDFKRGRVVHHTESGWSVDHEIPVFPRNPGYLDQRIP